MLRRKKSSDAIVERARAQADTILNEQEIMVVARERASEIVERAKNDAMKMRTVTINYLDGVLNESRHNLENALTAVDRAKKTYDR